MRLDLSQFGLMVLLAVLVYGCAPREQTLAPADLEARGPAAPDAALPAGIAAQTRRVMDNLALGLGGLDLDLTHVVQCRCYLTAFDRDYAAFNAVYETYFAPHRLPARTTVGVTALALGALVEIDALARRPAGDRS